MPLHRIAATMLLPIEPSYTYVNLWNHKLKYHLINKMKHLLNHPKLRSFLLWQIKETLPTSRYHHGKAPSGSLPTSRGAVEQGAMSNIGYPSETHLKSKSCKNSFALNSYLNWPNVLKFCTEHSSITAVLCAKFRNDWAIETDVMDKLDFTRFEFKMSFGQ